LNYFDFWEIAKLAKGVTDDIYEAGYVLPDGTLLDFSGKRDGGPSGRREEDHRQLNFDLGENLSGSDAMVAFERLGAIRIDAASGLVDMETPPTPAQMTVIEQVLEANGGGYLDLNDHGRKASIQVETPDKAEGAIRRFYRGKDVPSTLFQGTADQGPRAAIQIPERFPDAPAVISLLENADLTSFLHESAHFFWEVMLDLARDPSAPQSLRDDVDYVPTRPAVLFGHHYASIAGLAPMLGPAVAVIWGWLPALLWVIFGTFFIGWVQDYASAVVAMREEGKTFGALSYQLIAPRARSILLIFIYLYLLLIMGAFGFVIGTVFLSKPSVPVGILSVILMGLLAQLHDFARPAAEERRLR